MRKREYEKPSMKVVEIGMEASLLGASGDRAVEEVFVTDDAGNSMNIIFGGGGDISIFDR